MRNFEGGNCYPWIVKSCIYDVNRLCKTKTVLIENKPTKSFIMFKFCLHYSAFSIKIRG